MKSAKIEPDMTHQNTKAERTRARIIDASIVAFADRGLRATSIAAVAKAAGVSPASVFGYFGSKEALFEVATEADAAAVIEEVAVQFLAIEDEVDFGERWTLLWRLFDDSVESHALLRRMLADPETAVIPQMLAMPLVIAGHETLAGTIAQAQADSAARRDIDPMVAAVGLNSLMITSVLTHRRLGHHDHPDPPDATLAVLNSALGPVAPAAAASSLRSGSVARPEGALGRQSPPDDDAPATKGARTRERILDAAVRLFAATGWSGTSVAQIAREVGITPAAVFAHFTSKDELFSQAFDHDAWALVLSLDDQLLTIDVIDRWPAIVEFIWETLDRYPLVQRVMAGRELDRAHRLLSSEAIATGTDGLRRRIATAQGVGKARADVSAAQLAQGLTNLAISMLVARSEAEDAGAPINWDEQLQVLGLVLRPERV